MEINFKYVGDPSLAYTPHHATEGASGCDLRNATSNDIWIPARGASTIPTGICVEIPEGYEGQLRPRSGIAVKKQLILLPSVGSLDSDYRGEIKATYYNPNNVPMLIEAGERIAQIIIAPYKKCSYNLTDKLTETLRGNGGYGSTGK